ncbi:protein BOBBER 1-like [Coffea eugenioides]|uniref:Protein BOBBER 1 n=1 Tax=Coffea arabica TaxID=13443 RepID=A0A6P6WXV9_COFAR|nr:protein BOBBER 1-like [Coffea arabica]XP_027165626.1 protein BOBBER 1-like [Coffea eugenioides]
MAIISDINAGDDQPQQQQTSPVDQSQQQQTPPVNQPEPEEEKKGENQEPPKPERLAPNKSNGLDMENYTWGQSLQEVTIAVPVPPGTKSRFVVCDVKKDRIKVGLKNSPPILDGEFFGLVKAQDSIWSLEDNDISILLTKQDKTNWWKSLLKGGPEIDTQKVQPEPSKLSDLDMETRSAVEKMMFDQRQKQLGLPTSEEIQNQELMKKFKEQFPNMDFSGSKILGGRQK